MTKDELWPIERRVLEYLDQHGPTHRERVVCDLSGKTRVNGSNGRIPMIMGAWCRRLAKAGLVRKADHTGTFRTRRGDTKTLWFYNHHEITAAGRALIRS